MGDGEQSIDDLNTSFTTIIDVTENSEDIDPNKTKEPAQNLTPFDLFLKDNYTQGHVYIKITEIIELNPNELNTSKKMKTLAVYIERNNRPFACDKETEDLVQLRFVDDNRVPTPNSHISINGFLDFINTKPLITVYFWKYYSERMLKNLDSIFHNLRFENQYNNRLLYQNRLKVEQLRQNERQVKSETVASSVQQDVGNVASDSPESSHEEVDNSLNSSNDIIDETILMDVDNIPMKLANVNIEYSFLNVLNSSTNLFDETMSVEVQMKDQEENVPVHQNINDKDDDNTCDNENQMDMSADLFSDDDY